MARASLKHADMNNSANLSSSHSVRTSASALLGALTLCACVGSTMQESQPDSGSPRVDSGTPPVPEAGMDAAQNHDTGSGQYNFTTFDGPSGPPTTINGINNNGTVVGLTTANGVSGSTNTNFLRTVGGTVSMFDVGDPAMGMATAVNSSNEIVGVANGQAFTLIGSTETTLTPFDSTSSIALGVNDQGAVVGQYVQDSSHTPGFLDINGVYTSVTPTMASVVTNVQGINNHGLAVGFYSEDGTTQHGFSLDTTTMKLTLLADPSTMRIMTGGLVLTQFLAVNDSGEAVGYYQTNDNSQYGFLFDLATSTYTFLDHPQAAPFNGVQTTQITGIDNAGEIAGFFIDSMGNQHGFVASQ
jgi:hypothetical protein